MEKTTATLMISGLYPRQKYAVVFTGDWRFVFAKRRLKRQLKHLGFRVVVFSPVKIARLNYSFFLKVSELKSLYKKGYGLWIWKPFILDEMLSLALDGDLVLYFDVGCDFIPTPCFESNLLEFTNSSSNICLVPVSSRTGLVKKFGPEEFKWSNRLLMEHLSLDPQDSSSAQYRATWIILKKDNQTRNLVKDWLSLLLLNNSELIVNTNNIGGYPIESRYDQSALSCLVKKKLRDGSLSCNDDLANRISDSIWCTRNFSLFPANYNTVLSNIFNVFFTKLMSSRNR